MGLRARLTQLGCLIAAFIVVQVAGLRAANCEEFTCYHVSTREYSLALCEDEEAHYQTMMQECEDDCETLQMVPYEVWCSAVDQVDCQCGNEGEGGD